MANNGWMTLPIGELTVNLDSVRIPVKESERKPGPYPYYGASGVVDHVDGYLFEGEHLLIAEDGENLRTRQTPIAFMATGKFWVNNHAHIVKGNHKALTRFLSYALSNTDISGFLSGSTMPKLTQGNMNRIQILTPPMQVQERIVEILGTLDDKIELNRRMNETLEAMARRLFRSWFVDFDPVHAKAAFRREHPKLSNADLSRRALPNMAPEIAELFPDSFEDSTLGPIPKGWRCGQFSDIAENPKRTTKPIEIAPGTPYIALEHIPRRQIGLDDWTIADSVASGKYRFNAGDILFGKLRPYFHKVGVAPLTGVCSTDVLVIVPTEPAWRGFCLGHISSDEMISHTDGASTGTRMPRTNWEDIARFAIAIPSQELAQAFDAVIAPALEQLRDSVHEARSLVDVRDKLLPRLLSGTLSMSRRKEQAEEMA